MTTKTIDFHSKLTRLNQVEKAVGDFSRERDQLSESLDSGRDEFQGVIERVGYFCKDLRELDEMYSQGPRIRGHNLERIWGGEKLNDFEDMLHSLGIRKDHQFGNTSIKAVKKGVIIRPWKNPRLMSRPLAGFNAIGPYVGAAIMGLPLYNHGSADSLGTTIGLTVFNLAFISSLSYLSLRGTSLKNPFDYVASELEKRAEYVVEEMEGQF